MSKDNLPGMSENSNIHSLNPNEIRLFLSWVKMATPIHNGKDEFPSNRVSHKCTSLCKGKTSEINKKVESLGCNVWKVI